MFLHCWGFSLNPASALWVSVQSLCMENNPVKMFLKLGTSGCLTTQGKDVIPRVEAHYISYPLWTRVHKCDGYCENISSAKLYFYDPVVSMCCAKVNVTCYTFVAIQLKPRILFLTWPKADKFQQGVVNLFWFGQFIFHKAFGSVVFFKSNFTRKFSLHVMCYK